MAQRITKLKAEKISCSICLDLLKDPMTIPCGHSYCMKCIKNHWDGEDDLRRIYSCPQCRKTFITRPALQKNFVLSALVEDLKRADLTPVDDCHAGPEDVACDVCTESKLKAVKSCLVCLASYCKGHLKPHYNAPPLKKHKLVDPSKNLQENICSNHDEVMKIFCRTDQQCICYLCLMDEHKGHETVPAAAERTEKQKELQERRQQIQQIVQDQEKDVKLLQQEVEAINGSADKAVEDNEKIFTDLIHNIQRRSSDVKQQIRSQQETEVSRVKELQKKLEQEITELKRKDAELEKLSNTEDLYQFLQNYPSLSALSESTHSSSITRCPLRYFEDVTAAVSELREKLQNVLRDTWTNISVAITKVDVLLSKPEPCRIIDQNKTRDELDKLNGKLDQLKNMQTTAAVADCTLSSSEQQTRAGFLRHARKITLNPNTAHKYLELSEGNRKVTMTNENQHYPEHDDRFTRRWQVLSKQRLSGRIYWEVEWSGRGVEIAVAYDEIEREGDTDEATFGLNENSWALCCKSKKYTFSSDGWEVDIDESVPVSSTVGVYLDSKAGILSFYSVFGSKMILIHEVQTTFDEPLYAGIWLSRSVGTTAEFIQLK